MPTPLHVVLIAGHRSVGDRGNPVERELTDDLARAYLKAFQDVDISVEWVNPTLTPGGLTGLAKATELAIARADAALVLALDLHFNGSESAVHTIVAHNRNARTGGQLASAFVQGRVAADVVENNTLDRRLAEAYSRAIVAAIPGMRLWGSTGVMLENQTGVGADGSRLGMMAVSAQLRAKAVRLTIEHGGTNDAKRPDFFNKCARAVVESTLVELKSRLAPSTPAPPAEPPPTGDPGATDLTAFLFGAANGYSFNPSGPVSKLWLENGSRTGRFPRLIDVLEGAPRHFVFSDGSVIAATGNAVTYITQP